MSESTYRSWRSPSSLRWLVGCVASVGLVVGLAWFFLADGIPVLWGPMASAESKRAGRELFEHEWTPNDPMSSGDGLGPVFNAKSCAACHFQGGVGGAGDRKHNATHFEVLPTVQRRELISGVVHTSSVAPGDRESFKLLRQTFPIITFPAPPPPPPGQNCIMVPPQKPPFDPLRTESIQSPALFGIGWIDRIPTKSITLRAQRRGMNLAMKELTGDFSGIPVGKVPYTSDGRVGKFGWRGQFATLEEFVASACANELGLGTPTMPQAVPFHKPQAATEVAPDLTKRQFRDLLAFVDTLPKPIEVASEAASRGKVHFSSVGCAVCHAPDTGGVKNVYSDFLLYKVEDPVAVAAQYGQTPPPESKRPDNVPEPAEWKTPPLWGVADSAPYMHDGSAPTLASAIQRHAGDAKESKAAYDKLTEAERGDLIKFLESLKAPPSEESSMVAKVTR